MTLSARGRSVYSRRVVETPLFALVVGAGRGVWESPGGGPGGFLGVMRAGRRGGGPILTRLAPRPRAAPQA